MKKGIMGGVLLILVGIGFMWNAFYWGSALVPEGKYFTDLWWSMPWMFTNMITVFAFICGGTLCIGHAIEKNKKGEEE